MTRLAPHRLELAVRRGGELVRYELTEIVTPLIPVIEFDDQFHRDFSSDPDARARVLEAARRCFRGEDVPLPLRVAGGTDEAAG